MSEREPTTDELLALGKLFARFIDKCVESPVPVVFQVPYVDIVITGANAAVTAASVKTVLGMRKPSKPGHN